MNFSTEVLEIRQLSFPVLDFLPSGIHRIRRESYFDVAAREFYKNGESDDAIIYDSKGLRCSIVAIRIFDLSPFNRFLHRSGYFFIGNEWKTGVRAEVDCRIEATLTFPEFTAELLEILLEKKRWWYDLTEEDIRNTFSGCTTIKEAINAITYIGDPDQKIPKRKSKIFQDLTELQKLG